MRDRSDEWTDPIWNLLDDCIPAYNQKASSARRAYERLKLTQLTLVSAVPVLAGFQGEIEALLRPELTLLPRLALAVLGIAFIVLEFIQHQNQYQENAFEFDARHKVLEQEKFLFLAEAGPYAEVEDKRVRLIERVGDLLLPDMNGFEGRSSERHREYRMAA